jgi:uncharacterized Fe-S cluster-containing radical SAM superfamily protein
VQSESRVLSKALLALLWGRLPGQLVIQYTDSCNARCAQCGMAADNRFDRSKLDDNLVRRILETAASRGVMSVSLTGGEPLLYTRQVFELLAYARDLGIRFTRTGTNGFMLRDHAMPGFEGRVARLAARISTAKLHTFWISLDSADAAYHEANRGLPGVYEGIRRAMPLFHSHGVYPAVNLGLNRMMGKRPIDAVGDLDLFATQVREALRDFYRSVVDMGFTTANVCYPMSMDNADEMAAYRATSAASMVGFTAAERTILFRVVAEVTREFRPYLRIFTPLCSLTALSSAHDAGPQRTAACRGGVDYYYVAAADATLYPCGFRGLEALGDPADECAWMTDPRVECRRCDWECFRDPSQLFAPPAGLLRHPLRKAKQALADRHGLRVWYEDLRYYSACDYFATSRGPRFDALARFSPLYSVSQEPTGKWVPQ